MHEFSACHTGGIRYLADKIRCNLYLCYPSNIQIISQEQLNVGIFSSHGQSSHGQERPQGWEHPLNVFAANIWTSEQNVGLATNSNLILLTNIWVCPNTLLLECWLLSGMIRNGQDRSGMIRTGQEWSGLVRNDKNWSERIRTGQEWSGMVRNGQDWSAITNFIKLVFV